MSQNAILEALDIAKQHPDDPHQIAITKALQDYLKVQGKILKVSHLLAWPTDKHEGPDGRDDFTFYDKPVLVRITNTPLDDIKRTCDRFIDPEWNAEVIEPHPDLDPTEWDVKNIQVYGTSYNIDTGEMHNNDSDWEIVQETLPNKEPAMPSHLSKEFLVKDYSTSPPNLHIANDQAPVDSPESIWYWIQKTHYKEAQVSIYPLGDCVLDLSGK